MNCCYRPNYISYEDDNYVYPLTVISHYDAITLVMLEPKNRLLFVLESLEPRPVRWWVFDFNNYIEDLINWLSGNSDLRELMLTKIPSFIGKWTWNDKNGNLIVRETDIYIPTLLAKDYVNIFPKDISELKMIL